MPEPPIDVQREEYRAQRDLFQNNIKPGLVARIRQHQSAILELEKQIDAARPKTKKGEVICPYCDCKSRKYVCRGSEGEAVYECEICGRDNYDE